MSKLCVGVLKESANLYLTRKIRRNGYIAQFECCLGSHHPMMRFIVEVMRISSTNQLYVFCALPNPFLYVLDRNIDQITLTFQKHHEPRTNLIGNLVEW